MELEQIQHREDLFRTLQFITDCLSREAGGVHTAAQSFPTSVPRGVHAVLGGAEEPAQYEEEIKANVVIDHLKESKLEGKGVGGGSNTSPTLFPYLLAVFSSNV